MLNDGFLKRCILPLSAVCLFLLAFWVKNAAGINLFKNFSLSAYYPFSLLMPDYTLHTQAGQLILAESFELHSANPVEWLSVTTTDANSVSVSYEVTDENPSRHLLVKNSGEYRWHISHRYLVAVRKGDTFGIEALLRSDSKGGYAEVQVSAIDPEGHVIRRKWRRIRPAKQGEFEQVKQRITIDEGVALIRFRLAGRGEGEFRFDDITFRHLESGR